MIQFTNDDYKNFHVNIHNDTVTVVISLNVTEAMRPHLSPNLVHKSKKMLTYVLSSSTPISCVNEQKILSMANTLINKAMITLREAKQKVLEDQIKAVRKQSPRILPLTL